MKNPARAPSRCSGHSHCAKERGAPGSPGAEGVSLAGPGRSRWRTERPQSTRIRRARRTSVLGHPVGGHPGPKLGRAVPNGRFPDVRADNREVAGSNPAGPTHRRESPLLWKLVRPEPKPDSRRVIVGTARFHRGQASSHSFTMRAQKSENSNIYAVGDATAIPGPKQGHLALMQAGVAAAHIAWRINRKGEVPSYLPEFKCVMYLGGGKGLQLYSQ